MSKRLAEKSALVTGGSSGIGRAIAQRFAEEGASLTIADVREEPRLEETPTHEVIRQEGNEATYVKTDVTSLTDLQEAVERTVEECSTLDVLVNSAGVASVQSIVDTAEEEYRRVVSINQDGVFFGCKAAITQMQEQTDGGAIVNISSVGGLFGGANLSSYCTSKGGISNLTRALAIEQGPNDIRVNAINPGTTETAMTVKDIETAGEKGDRIPLRRDAVPEDVANAALYLASEEASFVTGHNLVVDGGASMKYY